MTIRRPLTLAALLLCGTAIWLLAAQPGTVLAAPSPAWNIAQSAVPSNLEPGSAAPTNQGPFAGDLAPHIRLDLANVGAAPFEDAVVKDVLPSGLTTVPAIGAQYEILNPKSGPEIETAGGGDSVQGQCSASGQVVTCTVPEAILPGSSLKVYIALEVVASQAERVENEVTVESSGHAAASRRIQTTIGAPASTFAFGSAGEEGVSGSAYDEAGEPPAAGTHPFAVSLTTKVQTKLLGAGTQYYEAHPVEPLRKVELSLPEGLVVNPQASNVKCLKAEFEGGEGSCPAASQVGVVHFDLLDAIEDSATPLYNLQPEFGAPAEFGFNISGPGIIIRGGLSGGFDLTATSSELLTRYAIDGVRVQLWGVPSDPRHDRLRATGKEGEHCTLGCAIAPSPRPFLTMPTACRAESQFKTGVTSWLGSVLGRTEVFRTPEGEPQAVEGCNQLAFEPTIASQATTNAAETSAGLDFSVHQPQDESLEGRSTAALKNATVSLPAGMSLNPAAANGLDSCTEAQMGYAPEDGKIRFATTPQSCPNAAKVGNVEVTTPLLDHKLPGAIYVAKPYQNPFGSLLAIYLAVEDPESGIVAKLAGEVEPNPVTGQLTATFTENPQLPIEDIALHFFNGARGVLTTPLTCGTHTTTSTLTPWSTPEGVDVHPSGSFETTAGCYGSEAQAPKTVSFTAGTQSPLSGAYSPFILRLARPDGSQHITGLETTLPEGLLGKLAGVSYCPESGIAQAKSREVAEKGKEEQQNPSCPSSSEVGTVNVTAGSGITPIPVSGHAYLAGPYKGAPLSLVVIVPAVAGPFDLGTVVDRVALNVGEYDARIHAVVDPLPTIRDGIPLDVRSIELKLDRPSFTLNPTSCEAMAIEGSVSTQAGQSAALKNRFQVGECGRLAFKPKVAISLKGATKKNGLPALKATVTYPQGGGYANIARAQVSLPHSEFLEQGNIGQACTKVILAAHACPTKSIYGTAKAWTPLLDKPLEGPVYLVGGYGYKLPALVAELNGQIRVLLVGKIDTGSNRGIRNTFEAVPDAPIEKFNLELKGGKKYGLLINSENICKTKQVGQAFFTAQNGKSLTLKPTIANSCGKAKGKKGAKGKRHKKGAQGTGSKKKH